MTALLSIRGLRLDVPTPGGARTILDGVDLDVAAGECVGVLGESGAGKSSLAGLLLGLPPRGAPCFAAAVRSRSSSRTRAAAVARSLSLLRGRRRRSGGR